ncbi:hypothetical protein [Actinoplanes sp. M2I2]|uniref:hypothetical protein n=1 Tax=Actinoplanes sp. M2I2 TaxID=1734444 RepID=UPI0020224EA2|nr:hypothetical protein [Actinoplanes sp. M2I2]
MFTFKVTPEGGEPFEVTATSRDIARWERTNRDASLHKLQSDMRISDLYKIAHNAAERQSVWHGPLKEFEDSVDLEVLDDDEVDPTQSAA